ncbi:unnamed protein product, partial [Symbiodinium sp. CCMP2456]
MANLFERLAQTGEQREQNLVGALQNVLQQSRTDMALSQEALSSRIKEVFEQSREKGEIQLHKLVKAPEAFSPSTWQEERNSFGDFKHRLRTWLGAVDTDILQLMDKAEKNPEKEFKFSSLTSQEQTNSKKLYSILSSYTKNRPQRVVTTVKEENGLEAYRQLVFFNQPNTKARSLQLHREVMGFRFDKDKTYNENFLKFEELIDEYEKASKEKTSDSFKMGTVIDSVPVTVRQHILLNIKEDTTYDDLRTFLTTYENAKRWTQPTTTDLINSGKDSYLLGNHLQYQDTTQGPQIYPIDSEEETNYEMTYFNNIMMVQMEVRLYEDSEEEVQGSQSWKDDPLYRWYNTEVKNVQLRDAQGKSIAVQEHRLIDLEFKDKAGNKVQVSEVFMIGNVINPLLAIGKMMKQGRMPHLGDSSRMALVDGDKSTEIPIYLRNNSLAASAFVQAVVAVREGQLVPVLFSDTLQQLEKRQRPGWCNTEEGKIHYGMNNSHFVDPTMTLSFHESLFYRTTFVKENKENKKRWILVEINRPYQEMEDPFMELPYSETETITVFTSQPESPVRFCKAKGTDHNVEFEVFTDDKWEVSTTGEEVIRRAPMVFMKIQEEVLRITFLSENNLEHRIGFVYVNQYNYKARSSRQEKMKAWKWMRNQQRQRTAEKLWKDSALCMKEQAAIVLIAVDSWSRTVAAVPTSQKGRGLIDYMADAVVSMASQLQYSNIILKGDNENTMQTLKAAVQRKRTAQGMGTHLQDSVTGQHQTNGIAERMIQTVRRQALCHVQMLQEKACLGISHQEAIFAWAFRHAAWCLNRFHTCSATGMTTHEFSTGKPWKGSLVEFGETLLCHVVPGTTSRRKGDAQWCKGTFLGKTENNLYLVYTQSGLRACRSAKRIAGHFDKDLIASMTINPWDVKPATLGTRVLPRKVLPQPDELQLHQVYHQYLCQLNKDLSNFKDHNLQPQQTLKQK